MEMSIPIENQEIPQTGLNSERNNITERELKKEIKGLILEYHASAKALKAEWKTTGSGEYYNFQFYTSHINPERSMLKEGIVNAGCADIKGLPSGQRVFIRVRMLGIGGLGPWCKAVEKRTP